MTRLTLFLLSASLLAYPSGSRVPNGNSGEPNTGTPCASCHTVTLNPAGGRADLALPSGNSFNPGEKQRWTVTVTDPDSSKARAFQLTASAGTFTAVTSTVVNTASSGRQYVNQSSPASSFTFDWTPPASATDAVTVWLAGVATRGTRNTNVYTSSLTLQLAAATNPPSIQTSGGVVNAASFTPGITPGSWVTIFGKNLAPAGVARAWKSEEIVNGRFPTALEGTRVRINGRDAAVSYVSETQLNVQAPDDDSRGSVAVEVITSAGTSASVTTTLQTEAPALFRFSPSGAKYPAAVHLDGVFAGPSDLFSGAVTLRPARPGDTILLFGNGFGATNPTVPALSLFSGAAPLVAAPQIRIGGVNATVSFAGLSAAGLYQFNVLVPEVADGDQRLEVIVSGQTAPGETYLTIRR